jgi:hypothetical protein
VALIRGFALLQRNASEVSHCPLAQSPVAQRAHLVLDSANSITPPTTATEDLPPTSLASVDETATRRQAVTSPVPLNLQPAVDRLDNVDNIDEGTVTNIGDNDTDAGSNDQDKNISDNDDNDDEDDEDQAEATRGSLQTDSQSELSVDIAQPDDVTSQADNDEESVPTPAPLEEPEQSHGKQCADNDDGNDNNDGAAPMEVATDESNPPPEDNDDTTVRSPPKTCFGNVITIIFIIFIIFINF